MSLGRRRPRFDTDCLYKLMTNGANIRGIWNHALDKPTVQLDNLYTNDIYAVLVNYGVEAARRTLVNEIFAVFKSYNIDVDYRHLELIADYMVSK